MHAHRSEGVLEENTLVLDRLHWCRHYGGCRMGGTRDRDLLLPSCARAKPYDQLQQLAGDSTELTVLVSRSESLAHQVLVDKGKQGSKLRVPQNRYIILGMDHLPPFTGRSLETNADQRCEIAISRIQIQLSIDYFRVECELTWPTHK